MKPLLCACGKPRAWHDDGPLRGGSRWHYIALANGSRVYIGELKR